MKQAAGIWQPVTITPWSGMVIDEPHAPIAASSAAAAAQASARRPSKEDQRMGRHLAVAARAKASAIARPVLR
jgi:hypothetical protein